MNLLVTGGCGFIGSHFVRKALSRGHTVHNLDFLTYASIEETTNEIDSDLYTFSKLDISASKDLDSIDFIDYQYVIHFAAESHVDRSIISPKKFIDTNILGTYNLLEKLRKSPETKFLYISTDEVYGSIAVGSWDEDCPILPRSPYSASKASGELLCNAYRNTYNLSILITRTCNNFGPYQNPEKLIPKTILNIMKGIPIPVYGKGENYREWIYVEDHVNLLLSLLEKNTKYPVYNIAGLEYDNLSLVRLILQITNTSESQIQFVTDRQGHDFRYSIDDKRLQNELGIVKKLNIIDDLTKTINWYQSNSSWIESIIEKQNIV